MLDTNEKRPRRYTDEMSARAAEKLADMLIEHNSMNRAKDTIVSDLLSCRIYWRDNGYQLAKALERDRFWDPDPEMVETLDHIDTLLSSELDDAVKDWVLRLKPTPQFAIGDMVAFDCPHEGERKGPVYSIYPERACYVVDDRGTHNGGRVVAYEDVRAA